MLFKEDASDDLDTDVERIEDKNGDAGKSATDPSLNPETAAARAHGQAGKVKLSFAKHPGQVGLIWRCVHQIMGSLDNDLLRQLLVHFGVFPNHRTVQPTNRVWQIPQADGPYKIRISLPHPHSVGELASVGIPPVPAPVGSHGVDPDGNEFDADVMMESWPTGHGTRQLELTIRVPDKHNRACTVICLEIPFKMGQLEEDGRIGGPDLTAGQFNFLMHIYAE